MRRVILLAAALSFPAYAMAQAMQPGLYRGTVESPGEKPESYRTVCADAGTKATTQVKGTFTRDSFDMDLAMSVNADPPTKFHMTGKRIGECRKEGSEGSKRGRK